jgi:hypothetical protein
MWEESMKSSKHLNRKKWKFESHKTWSSPSAKLLDEVVCPAISGILEEANITVMMKTSGKTRSIPFMEPIKLLKEEFSFKLNWEFLWRHAELFQNWSSHFLYGICVFFASKEHLWATESQQF